MRRASAIPRTTASLATAFLLVAGLVSGCAAPPSPEGPAGGRAGAEGGTVPGSLSGAGTVRIDGIDRRTGSLYLDPATNRTEVVTADLAHTALLIGDSQSAGAAGVGVGNTWPTAALARLGFRVDFCGLGGTGFVAANGSTGNYPDALERGDWRIPYGTPGLVVVEGGGNDATRGATDKQILDNAGRLLADLRQSYPAARIVLVGTLSRSPADGGGRRAEVDALLSSFASAHQLSFIGAGNWITQYALAGKMADGVHLTVAGHRILTDVLAARLAAIGATPPGPAVEPAGVVSLASPATGR